MSRQRYKAEEVAEAIREAGGVLAVAADILGCDRVTVWRYTKRYVTVQEAYDEANETSLDVAEGGLLSFVRGEIKGMSTRERLDAIKYYLSTKGKHRGYTKKEEREHSGRIRLDSIDWESLSDEQVAALAAGADPAEVIDE